MGFFVDPHSMRSDGRLIESIRADAEGDLGRAHGETATGGRAAWGTDLPIAAGYDELTAVMGDAVALISAVLARSGAGTQAMADAYEHADTAARDGLARVEEPA